MHLDISILPLLFIDVSFSLYSVYMVPSCLAWNPFDECLFLGIQIVYYSPFGAPRYSNFTFLIHRFRLPFKKKYICIYIYIYFAMYGSLVFHNSCEVCRIDDAAVSYCRIHCRILHGSMCVVFWLRSWPYRCLCRIFLPYSLPYSALFCRIGVH